MELLPETEIADTIYAAKVVLARECDGHFLILWRNIQDDRRPGGPDFPGGELEPGETYAEAARRETFQEAGIDLGEVALDPLYELTKLEKRGRRIVAITQMVFHATVQRHELAIGDEHSSGGWYSPEVAAQQLTQEPTKLLGIVMAQQRSAEDGLMLAS